MTRQVLVAAATINQRISRVVPQLKHIGSTPAPIVGLALFRGLSDAAQGLPLLQLTGIEPRQHLCIYTCLLCIYTCICTSTCVYVYVRVYIYILCLFSYQKH